MGHRLAGAGFDLVNGGHEGIMAATAKGNRDGGGHVTGVACAPIRSARGGTLNPFSHEVIDAPDLLTRMEIMLCRASGFVVTEGGTGTLAELALAWEFRTKGMFAEKPIVCLGTFWQPVIQLIQSVDAAAAQAITVTRSAADAAAILRERAVEISAEEASYTANLESVAR